MRIFDALSTIKKSGTSKKLPVQRMTTIWSEHINPKNILPEHPRPQFARENWFSLNGPWDYAFTKTKKRPEAADGQILVPFSPECTLSGVGKRLEPKEYLWYFRYVYLPKIPEGKRLLLHFGAVDQCCSVWWNGKLLGRHQNGYLSFSFDVTELAVEGNNTLWIRVQDETDTGAGCIGKQTLHPGGMFYTAQSGIWQTVWMEWIPTKHIDSLKITPLFDKGLVRLEIALSEPQNLEIHILEKHFSFCRYIDKEDFQDASQTLTTEIPLPDFKAWSPENPFLYTLQLVTETDRVQSYFAMRKFSVGTDTRGIPRLYLNNKPYFFNGVLDQGYWPESLYTAPSDEAMIFDIQSMKNLGFNMIRKHLKIEPMRWYYHCDRLGMIVWQDMVNGGGKPFLPFVCYLPTALPFLASHVNDQMHWLLSRRSSKERNQWIEDCFSTVKQLYNCPCIGLWTPFNEGWGQFDAAWIALKIKGIDETRLVDHASGWFDQKGGDVKSVHNYFRKLTVRKERRPFILSEYGGYSCPVEGHLYSSESYGYRAYRNPSDFSRAFRLLQKKIRDLEAAGLAGAVYTQVSDVEEEINGLLTYDRKICKVE